MLALAHRLWETMYCMRNWVKAGGEPASDCVVGGFGCVMKGHEETAPHPFSEAFMLRLASQRR